MYYISFCVICLLDIPDINTTEHLGSPCPSICQISYEDRALGPVIDARTFVSRASRVAHFDTSTVDTFLEVSRQGGFEEAVV